MARTDYVDDPDAPAANSLVVAASAVVRDAGGRVLLHRRADNDLWSIPGGGMEPGESIADCVAREVREETGFEVAPRYVVGVYSDPRHVVAYDDGEVRQQFSICFACELVGGERSIASDELLEVAWVAPDELDGLAMSPAIRLRIDDCLAGARGIAR